MKKTTMRRKMMFAMLSASLLCAAPFAGAQEIQERTIRTGHLLNKDHPVSKGTQKFAEIVAAKTGGKIKVKEFPSSQLGSEIQQQSALQGGTQEMITMATSTLAGIVKEFGLLDFPFIVSNEKEADMLLDGPVGRKLFDKLPAHGLVGLAYWENGFRNVTNSKRPITRPEDLDGLKIRVMPNPVYLEAFKAVKANPVPLAFGELFTALETKAVDAQENPYAIIVSNKFNEVQKYLSITNHTYNAFAVVLSKKFWDKLSPTEQKILQEAAIEARDYERQISRAASAKALGELKTGGMAINEFPKTEVVRMRQQIKPVVDKFAASYDPELVRTFNTELDKIHGK
ncbi:MAG: transporter substrate-binding protein [Herminiimonas sp.]|jgi:tripartite ATP-independent transporter DctP family solute receptor|nr:transporter substrate-binding protein [Herminiimonas sp.]